MEENITSDSYTNEVPIKEDTVVEKKSGGCMKAFSIVFLVFLFVFLLIGGGLYFGYRRVLQAMEPVDLGVTYSYDDYESLINELGLEADPSLLCLDCPVPSYSEPTEVSVSVTNAQASAVFEYINQYLTNASVDGTQIKIGNGMGEISTTLTFQGRKFPVYLSGTVFKETDRSIGGEIYDIKVGALEIPGTVLTMVQNTLLDIANDRIAGAGDTVRIDSIELTEGNLNFEGLVPTKAQ